MLRVAVVLSAAAALVALPSAGPAGAAAGDGTITGYAVEITVHQDGSLDVIEAIDYTFTDDSHGIYRNIPNRYDYQPQPDFQRVYDISDVTVFSPTGAPTSLDINQDGDYLSIRVGDPDRTIRGPQTYVISYHVTGALNSFDDHEELYWNAIGTEWSVPIASGEVVVRAAQVADGLCFWGPPGSTRSCEEARVGPDRLVARQGELGYGQGMTVVVGMPPGSVTVPPPVLQERWSLQRAFSLTAATIGTALALLLAGGVGVGFLAYRRGRDRRYLGQIPGLAPVGTGPAAEELRPFGQSPEGPVEWAPPDDLRPGLVGTLQDETANVLDVTATIVDLAVRGYIRIDELPRSSLFGKRDWQLVQMQAAGGELQTYERTLFDALFAGRNVVRLSELKQTFAKDLKKVQDQMYDELVYRKWYRRRPDSTRTTWYVIGFLAVGAAVGVTYLLARFTHFGVIGLALVLVGLALLLAARSMPARTGAGSAALARVLGFRRYLATAEANQLRWEEAASLFSKYLPFAIVFGEADRWAKVFQQLAATQGVTMPAVAWYTGPSGWSFGDFGDSISAFSTSTAGSLSAVASSGGSGFGGGGFSGGGGGGGGGGGW
jgi:uncharacterized membrane protein YgcG